MNAIGRQAVLAGALGLAAAVAAAGPGSADREFAMMDLNQDGKLSVAEHAAGARSMFEQMDVDRDGRVTAAEMTAAQHAIAGRQADKAQMPAADKIRAVDADGDGILTDVEHAKASASMFTKMDDNKDSFLSENELAAGHARLMKQPAR